MMHKLLFLGDLESKIILAIWDMIFLYQNNLVDKLISLSSLKLVDRIISKSIEE